MFTVFIEKHLHISGPSKFKPMLLEGQLCVFYISVLCTQATLMEQGLQKRKRECLCRSYFPHSVFFLK